LSVRFFQFSALPYHKPKIDATPSAAIFMNFYKIVAIELHQNTLALILHRQSAFFRVPLKTSL
ncbi:MAG: hypothetical protein B0D92_06255, partial [Spirochaeta sp. LUC14_002_19_P3]